MKDRRAALRRIPIRLGGWLDKMLVVGLICVVASSAAVLTQIGGTGVKALNIPADALAQPYPGSLSFPQPPVEPPTTTQAGAKPPAATPPPPPPCPVPSSKRPAGVPSAWPLVVAIPKLGVDAQVEQAGLDRHGDMQVPRNPCDVAWFKPGTVPGAPGDAVVDGHLDWTTGPSVFWNLHKLRRGDEIDVLEAGGKKLRFIVSRLRNLPHTTFQTGLFSTTGPAMLSLYTCFGTWEPWARTYSQRLVVDAVLRR